jgi:hypothetical protein
MVALLFIRFGERGASLAIPSVDATPGHKYLDHRFVQGRFLIDPA